MIHDMSLTDTYVVGVRPVGHRRPGRTRRRLPFPFEWDPDRAGRVGLLPRNGSADDIIWCDVDPCFVFHPLNTYDAADGTVVVDVCRYDALMVDDRHGPFADHLPRSIVDHRAVARRVTETRLDDRPQEFPRTTRARPQGAPLRLTSEIKPGEAAEHPRRDPQDRHLDRPIEAHEFGRGRGGAEPVFVPKADGIAEDAGWILTVVYDATTEAANSILEPQLAGAEVAGSVPQRVPFGFHGNWVSDSSVSPD